MHYHAQVVIPSEGDAAEHVARLLAPHEEGRDGGESLWDWYQIGGRYTGTVSGYDPEKDPRNVVVCNLCNGTGKRDDALGRQARQRDPSYSCNGCQGEGKRVAWPTQWAQHDGDVIALDAVPYDLSCFALFLPDGEVLLRERWTGETWEKTGFDGNVAAALRERDISEGRLVTVDYHS